MIPLFLATGYSFVEIYNISDVQQIIDAAVALITAPANPARNWKPFTASGGDYVSPSNTALQVPQFKITMTKSTQYRLSVAFTSMSNMVTVQSRGIQIPSTNVSTARIFAGDGHFAIDVNTWSGPGEFAAGGTLDVTPDMPNFPGINTVWVSGSRRTDWARDNYDSWDYAWMQHGDDSTVYGGNIAYAFRVSGGSNGPKKMLSGAWLYRPRELFAKVRGDTGTFGMYHWIGRCWQTLILGDALFVLGSKFYVPIDTGVLAQFCSLVGPTAASGMRLAMRCG